MLLAGASAIPYDLGPIDIGKARRTGQAASSSEDTNGFPQAEFAPDVGASNGNNGAAAASISDSVAVNSAAGTSASANAPQAEVIPGR